METYEGGEAFSVVGDPSRRSIVLLLAERPHAVVDLAAVLPISRPAVSQHLRVLKDAGLVDEEPVGTRRVYRLNEAGLLALRDQLETFWNRALQAFQDIAERREESPDEH